MAISDYKTKEQINLETPGYLKQLNHVGQLDINFFYNWSIYSSRQENKYDIRTHGDVFNQTFQNIVNSVINTQNSENMQRSMDAITNNIIRIFEVNQELSLFLIKREAIKYLILIGLFNQDVISYLIDLLNNLKLKLPSKILFMSEDIDNLIDFINREVYENTSGPVFVEPYIFESANTSDILVDSTQELRSEEPEQPNESSIYDKKYNKLTDIFNSIDQSNIGSLVEFIERIDLEDFEETGIRFLKKDAQTLLIIEELLSSFFNPDLKLLKIKRVLDAIRSKKFIRFISIIELNFDSETCRSIYNEMKLKFLSEFEKDYKQLNDLIIKANTLGQNDRAEEFQRIKPVYKKFVRRYHPDIVPEVWMDLIIANYKSIDTRYRGRDIVES